VRESFAILAMCTGAIASCSPAATAESDKLRSIPDVIADIDALNGKTISVAGYLGECAGYECALFENEEGKRRYDRLIADLRRGQRSALAEPANLGIGSGANFEFDRRAGPFRNSYVVITGRATSDCRHRGVSTCTDRSTDLEPTEIRSWVPPGMPSKRSRGE
jgi:hypothetical protein